MPRSNDRCTSVQHDVHLPDGRDADDLQRLAVAEDGVHRFRPWPSDGRHLNEFA